MAITRTPIIDDDGSGSTGTVLDNSWKQELYNQIDGAISTDSGTSVTTPSGGSIDLVTTPAQIRIARINPSSGDVTIYSASPGRPGDLLFIQHVGADATKYVYLIHDQGGRPYTGFYNRVASGWTVLGKFGSAIYQWDTTFQRWTMLSHDQGNVRDVPYSAGNFTSNVGSWTTVFGSTSVQYEFDGSSVRVRIAVNASTTAGTPALLTVAGFPFTFSPPTGGGTYVQGMATTGASLWGPVLGTLGTTSVGFSRADGLAFPNGTMYLLSQFACRIT